MALNVHLVSVERIRQSKEQNVVNVLVLVAVIVLSLLQVCLSYQLPMLMVAK